MAQTQPNFERMQTSVQEMVRGAQNTVREISLISNIPIVNQGNQIQQILIQMQSFQAEMRTDNRRFQEEMRGQINGLRTEIQELRTEINGLRVEMRTGFRDVNNRINVV